MPTEALSTPHTADSLIWQQLFWPSPLRENAAASLLTSGKSIAQQRRARPGKDSIPLLKLLSQVRILPGAQREGPAQEGFPPRLGLRRPRGRATRVRLWAGSVRLGRG